MLFVLLIAFREDASKSNIEGANVIKAKQLMDGTIAQLYEHKKKVGHLYTNQV